MSRYNWRLASWAVAGLVTTLLLMGFQSIDFARPVRLNGDHVFALKVAKEAVDGMMRFNTKLAAPLVNDNLYFPLFDFSYKAITWIIAQFTTNIFLVINVLYLIGVILVFLSAFWAICLLAISPALSAIAATAFTVSPYFALRSFNHDYLSLYYSVPLIAALPLILSSTASGKSEVSIIRSPWFIAAVVAAGTSGVYYGLFGCIFACLGIAMLAADRRSFTPLLVAFVASATIVILLVATTYGPSIKDIMTGTIPRVPERGGAISQLHHGLLLSNAMRDFFNVGLWKKTFLVYQDAIASPPLSLTPGESYAPEWPGVLITTIILACAGLAPVIAFARQRDSLPWALAAMCSLLIAFGVVFSLRGGLGFVFNYMVMSGIRAQERVLPFLSFYALVVACIAVETIRVRYRLLGIATMVAFAVGLTPGVKSAYQIIRTKQQSTTTDAAIVANKDSVLAMLEVKRRLKISSVLQLPVVPWPEYPFVLSFDPYQHFMPYFLDAPGSQTRWSYGMSWWQIEFHHLALAAKNGGDELAKRSAEFGYNGALIEKAAYTPDQLVPLRKAFENGCKVYSDDLRELYTLGKPCT